MWWKYARVLRLSPPEECEYYHKSVFFFNTGHPVGAAGGWYFDNNIIIEMLYSHS